MHATICTERLQAAQAALNAMSSSRVWTFTHPTTGCFCRSEFDGAILRTEVTDGPAGLNPDGWWDKDEYERAIIETLDDLDDAGVARTAVSDAAAAERELRLVAESLREIPS